MFDLKKTTAVVLALGSSAVFAGSMGPVCTPGNVTVPCERMAWDIGGQALYLQTNFSKDFSYYPTGINNRYDDQSGQWNWGFQLEASYHFNTGNDIDINWYHLDGRTTHFNFNPYGTANSARPINVQLDQKNQWDAVNAELGQFVDFSANQKIRFHGGLQFARVETSLNGHVTDNTLRPVVTVPVNLTTKYNGVGPRAGLDMNYVFGNGFGIYAKAAAALLVGTGKFEASGQNVGAVNTFLASPTVTTSNNHGSRTIIVPELEAKLGGKYTYAMAQGDLTLDAGYMWFNYFSPLNNQNILNNVQQSRVVSSNAIGTSDFGASGPYIGLKYVGSI